MTEYELCLREAEKTDAAELIAFLNQVGSESDYMTLDEAGILMKPALMWQNKFNVLWEISLTF